jgi:hypothetical protein
LVEASTPAPASQQDEHETVLSSDTTPEAQGPVFDTATRPASREIQHHVGVGGSCDVLRANPLRTALASLVVVVCVACCLVG